MIDQETLNQAIEEFNSERSPETWAKLLKYEPPELRVEFGGTSCASCSFDEHFVDLEIHLTETTKVKFELQKVEKPKIDQYFVTYHIKS